MGSQLTLVNQVHEHLFPETDVLNLSLMPMCFGGDSVKLSNSALVKAVPASV